MPKDHFENVAHFYGEFRPRYPARLFKLIADACTLHQHVWDCATGSGQAAVALAEIFDCVTATDASAAQLEGSEPRDNIIYRCAPAEVSGLDTSSVDAITVAQALHWFPLDAFFQECDRVLKPEGILAIWTYGLMRTNDETLNTIIRYYYNTVVGPYWPPERRLVDEAYGSIELPFEELRIPQLDNQPLILQQSWGMDQLIGYLRSWSASGYFAKANAVDPITIIRTDLEEAWPKESQTQLIQWPITLRMSRKSTPSSTCRDGQG